MQNETSAEKAALDAYWGAKTSHDERAAYLRLMELKVVAPSYDEQKTNDSLNPSNSTGLKESTGTDCRLKSNSQQTLKDVESFRVTHQKTSVEDDRTEELITFLRHEYSRRIRIAIEGRIVGKAPWDGGHEIACQCMVALAQSLHVELKP